MPAPDYTSASRPDDGLISIPNFSEWLSLAPMGDAAIWAAYADHKSVQKGSKK